MLVASLEIGIGAFLLALTGAMAPGPMLTVAIEHAVTRGRRPAMLLLVGHGVLEAVLLVGLAFGLNRVLTLPVVTMGLSLVGGAFLVWMGGALFADVVRRRVSLQALPADERRPSRWGPVARGAVVSLSNPYWTIWWATVGLKLASDGLAVGPAGIAAFFFGHELADIAWYGLVIHAVASGKRFMTETLFRSVLAGCAVFLVGAGGAFIVLGGRQALGL